MLWTEFTAVIMVGIGALFMLLSMLLAVKMLPSLTANYKKKWAILILFKGFFFLGYLAFILILITKIPLPVEFITGLVFLGGAFFVFLVIRLSKHTISDIAKKEDTLHQLNTTLENKVTQRTSELEKSMTELNNEMLERKEANKKISRMSQELRQILDTISTGFRVIDTNHVVTQVNKRFCSITGLAHDELVGSFCYDNFDDGDCRNSKSCRMRTIQKHSETSETIVIKTTKNGNKAHFRISSAPMLDGDGNIVGLLEDFQDITPLLRAQEEKELAQNRLHQAAKLESVGQLAAGIAHEINTPVQFVGTNLEFLRESFDELASYINTIQPSIPPGTTDTNLKLDDWEYLSEEIPQALEQSMQGLERVRKLVQSMKEFSHPGSKEVAPADINTIIENTLAISQNEWQHVAELYTELPEDLPQVPCRTDELGQVFLNIIINAGHAIADKVKGTTEKGKLTIRTIHRDDVVEIYIIDTGKGMSDELCDKIFDPFFTTKEVGKGTGQGLSIARDIVVNKHQGKIRVESVQGEGSTFIISLPLLN
jgi:two-component system, NtrC family, sensor kinase